MTNVMQFSIFAIKKLRHSFIILLMSHSFSPGAAVASVRPAAPSRTSPPLRDATPVGATPSPGAAAARRVVRVLISSHAVRAHAASPLVVGGRGSHLTSPVHPHSF